jgi:hypothetical protein
VASSRPETLDSPTIAAILAEEDTAVISMIDGERPYAVPVSYAYLDDCIVFHCAMQGRKLDVLRRNPNVAVVVDRHPDRMKPHHPEGRCEYRYESVICSGRAEIVADAEQRLIWLERFRRHFFRRLNLPETDDPLTVKAAERTGLVIIRIEERSGRRKS